MRTHRLSRRHSEVVVALALAGGGVTGGRLAVELSDAEIPLVSLRVEMSMLRSLLGPEVVGSRPYQLRAPIRADFLDVRDLTRRGRGGAGALGVRRAAAAVVRRPCGRGVPRGAGTTAARGGSRQR